MLQINRILIQLDKAIELANSDYIQERSMSVILFDNLIEVQLFRIAEHKFSWDTTTWYNGPRIHSYKKRMNALSYYENLIKFLKDNEALTESDYELLKYAHSIRNRVYHKGDLDEIRINLAILLYYSFIHDFFKNIPNSFSLIELSDSLGLKQIDFGQGIQNYNQDYKIYYEEAVNYIFSKINAEENIDDVVIDILTKQIDRVKLSIDFIEKESKNINFYHVLGRYWYLNNNFGRYTETGRKPKNLNSILLIYSFLRESKDKLDDIDELKIRQKKGRQMLRKHRSFYKGNYPFWTDIEKIEKRVKDLKGKPTDIVLKNLINIENKIGYLYSDLSDASSDLDWYIQLLIDEARGK